jgi:hypothetical protein
MSSVSTTKICRTDNDFGRPSGTGPLCVATQALRICLASCPNPSRRRRYRPFSRRYDQSSSCSSPILANSPNDDDEEEEEEGGTLNTYGTSGLATISLSLRDKSHSPIEAPSNYLSAYGSQPQAEPLKKISASGACFASIPQSSAGEFKIPTEPFQSRCRLVLAIVKPPGLTLRANLRHENVVMSVFSNEYFIRKTTEEPDSSNTFLLAY